ILQLCQREVVAAAGVCSAATQAANGTAQQVNVFLVVALELDGNLQDAAAEQSAIGAGLVGCYGFVLGGDGGVQDAHILFECVTAARRLGARRVHAAQQCNGGARQHQPAAEQETASAFQW